MVITVCTLLQIESKSVCTVGRIVEYLMYTRCIL